MNIFTIIATVVISALLVLFLKQYKPEYAMLVTIAACILVFFMILSDTINTITEIKTLFAQSGVETGYLLAVFKAIGICYITQFSADLCRDFGQTSLASKVELAGRIGIITLSIPLIRVIIQTASQLVGSI